MNSNAPGSSDDSLGENPSLQFLEVLDSHQLVGASIQYLLLPSDGHPFFFIHVVSSSVSYKDNCHWI